MRATMASGPSGSADSLRHAAVNRPISSSTTSTVIRPPIASVAMRTTAAFRSRKLPVHAARGPVAKFRNRPRASVLNATRVPVTPAN